MEWLDKPYEGPHTGSELANPVPLKQNVRTWELNCCTTWPAPKRFLIAFWVQEQNNRKWSKKNWGTTKNQKWGKERLTVSVKENDWTSKAVGDCLKPAPAPPSSLPPPRHVWLRGNTLAQNLHSDCPEQVLRQGTLGTHKELQDCVKHKNKAKACTRSWTLPFSLSLSLSL